MKTNITWMKGLLAAGVLGVLGGTPLDAKPLKIGYSDWPGWIAWEIGIKKGWFKEAGVEVEFAWMDYVESMDAYVAGNVDAVTMTNGDALVTGATGKPSVGIIINDFSNGNDMIVGAPGIDSLKDLAGKKVGVEEGFVCHLLLLTGLEKNGIDPALVTIVNTSTNETPQVLEAKAVDAIGAWQPNSGQALKSVPGSKPLFTSADVPGIIYDLLYVSPESLDTRKEDWEKVVTVWYRIAEFIRDEANLDETLEILSARVGIKPEEYEAFLKGTYILSLEEALERWEDKDGLGSVYGSTRHVNAFNLKFGVYEKSQDGSKYLNPGFTKAYAASLKSE
jgi:NitT/TauT family transport system substrate-binding protein